MEHAIVEVFTANTPNGIKVPIALGELGIPYELKTLVPRSAELRAADYLRINPNSNIPAIRHHDGCDTPIKAFESWAILPQLAEAFGNLRGKTPVARGQTLSWLFLQVAGLGPKMGNVAHFRSLK